MSQAILKSTGQRVQDISVRTGQKNKHQTPEKYCDVLIPHGNDFHHAYPGATKGRVQRVRQVMLQPIRAGGGL